MQVKPWAPPQFLLHPSLASHLLLIKLEHVQDLPDLPSNDS